MKKIVLCIIALAFFSVLLHGSQSPHEQAHQAPAKHVVTTDSDLLKILQQTRKQQLADPKHTRRIFDVDPIQHNENKKG